MYKNQNFLGNKFTQKCCCYLEWIAKQPDATTSKSARALSPRRDRKQRLKTVKLLSFRGSCPPWRRESECNLENCEQNARTPLCPPDIYCFRFLALCSPVRSAICLCLRRETRPEPRRSVCNGEINKTNKLGRCKTQRNRRNIWWRQLWKT